MSSLATTNKKPDEITLNDAKKGVLDLASVRRTDIKAVGTKAALLGELHGADLPVTPGLVVCVQTCTGLCATRTFSPGLLAELDAQLESVLPDVTWFAIRSSAIEGARAAEQNQPDTRCEYFVPRDALVVAIIAAATATADNSADGPIKRAVMIQPMVRANVSGVVFTGGLKAGSVENYLIEACWGLGRALVTGQTDPDRYQLDQSLTIIEQQRGRKQHQIKPNGTGLLVAVNEADRLAWTLTPSQLQDVITLTKRCASALGSVQDIEFALTDDSLVLLQSRPVIAAKLGPENVPAGRWLIFLPQLESFAEPFTPLTEDLLRSVLPDFARLIHGRVYLDFDMLSRRTPLTADDAQLTEALLFQHDLTKLPLSLGKLVRRLPFWISRAPWALQFWLRSNALSREQQENFWDYANTLSRDQTLNARELFERFVRGGSIFTATWRLPFILNATSSRYLLHMAVLNRLVKRWTYRELDDSTLQQLCTGNADTLSNDMVADIAALGREVAQVPELASAFAAPLNGLALHQLLTTHANPSFVSQFSAFVQRFGHRGTREFELASSRWHEEPDALLAMIGIASKNFTVADGYSLQLLARDDLHQAIGKRWQRRVIDYLLRRIRYYVSLQENTRHYAARALFLVRQRLLRLEDRLLREHKLQQTGDLFFLSWNDLQYLDSGQLSVDDASTLIASARDQHAERCSNKVRWTLGYDPRSGPAAETTAGTSEITETVRETPEQPNQTNQTNHDIVTGRCAAPGCADGLARIVTSQRELADFEPGEVLVLAFADPTMATAVQAATAVVCERGSAMSPISAMAREWGVPLLIGATNCTRAISTGEQVRVNASIGRVEVLAPPSQ